MQWISEVWFSICILLPTRDALTLQTENRERERERERDRKGLAALFAATDAVEWGEHVVVVAGLVILHAARVVGRRHVVVQPGLGVLSAEGVVGRVHVVVELRA